MNYQKHDGHTIAILEREQMIHSVQDALDLMVTAQYEAGCNTFILYKESLPEAFFDLKTGLAGEVLQKFSNYRMRLAIVGDFSACKSKALRDFIYECNCGTQVFWAGSVEDVMIKIQRIQRIL